MPPSWSASVSAQHIRNVLEQPTADSGRSQAEKLHLAGYAAAAMGNAPVCKTFMQELGNDPGVM